MYFYTKFKISLTINSTIIMSKISFDYAKSILERVSFDPILFCKELEKAIKTLLPYEIEQLQEWLFHYIIEKPELQQCVLKVNS